MKKKKLYIDFAILFYQLIITFVEMFLQNSFYILYAKCEARRFARDYFSSPHNERNTKLQLHVERFIRYRNGPAGRNAC